MRLFLATLSACLALGTTAQYVISGQVLDASTKEPLAFVPFAVEGMRTGTTSDIDGRFDLSVPHLPVNLRASYVGYEPLTITVADGGPLVVRLTASNTLLQAVQVVHTENPAHRIIRRAYANRKENDGLHRRSYRYTSYGKTVFDAVLDSAGRGPVDTTVAADTAQVDSSTAKFLRIIKEQHLLLIESATRKSFIPPAAEKEEVLAMRVSGLKDPSLLALVAQTSTFNIYAPQIDLSDKSYLGPIGPSSTSKYLFLMEDTLYQATDTVFVISYRPRTGTRFDGLKGLLYINTDGYAVQNVTAEPMERSGISMRFQQQHKRMPTANGDSAWFPDQLNTFIYATMVSVNGLNVVGESRIYLKDIELDVDIQRREVRGPELVMDRMSIRQDSTYWASLRKEPLGAKELRTYEMLDSLGQAEQLDRKMKFLMALTSGRLPMGPVDLRLNQILAYNAYEGLRAGIGLATNDRITRYASLGGYFAYGSKDRHWKYGGDLTIKPVYGRDLQLELAYGNDVAETGGVAFARPEGLLNAESIRKLFLDRMDRIERYSGRVRLRASSSLQVWLGAERALRVNDMGYSHVQRMGDDITLRKSDFLTGAFTMDLRWAFKEKLARLPDRELALGTKYPVVYVHAMKAEKGLWGGEWDTWRLDVMAEKTYKVRLLGDFSFRVMAGVADAEAPMPFLYNLRGTYSRQLPVASANVFETMRPDEFLADRYVGLHLKHSFGALLVRTKHFHPRPALVTSAVFGGLDRPEDHAGLDFSPLRKGYYESGLMIEDLLRFGANSFGVAGYYRYGPYALPTVGENLAVKLVLGYRF